MQNAGAATFNNAITSGAVITSGAGLVIADSGTIGSTSDVDAIAIGSDGDITLTQDLELQHDGAILSFGANDEVSLTHVHDMVYYLILICNFSLEILLLTLDHLLMAI